MTTMPLSTAADTRRLDLITSARTGEPARQAENTDSANRAKPLGLRRQMLTLGLNLAAPIALYYALRTVGIGIYPALIIGAVAPLLSAVIKIVKREPVESLSLFMLTMLLLSSAVSMLNGSPRFLLAKDGWLTAVTGIWMLCSVRSRRPLTFLFARPLLEGRGAFTAESWDSLWERLPGFRHVWRVATVIWGIAMLVDAAIRVVMAYTLPIDLVPVLNGALWPVTFVLLQVVDAVYFHRAGFWRMLRGEIDRS